MPSGRPLTQLLTLLRSQFRFGGIAACTALAALPLLLAGQAARAATYTVSDSNWGTIGAVNSFAWALAQANGNLGADTISISPGLAINVDGATAISGGWLTTISDDLTIEGHGATLIGNPMFETSGGTVYDKFNVDVFHSNSDILLQEAFSFGKLSSGISLNIEALNSDGLNGYLQLGDGSTASISGSTARNSVSYGQKVARSVFEALDNSTLNLSAVVLKRINPDLDSFGPAWSGAISGTNASLNMVRSSISQAAAAAGAVVWSGCRPLAAVNSTSRPPRFCRVLFTTATTPATAFPTPAPASRSLRSMAARSLSGRALCR